ncbi:DUF3106 domain-containing protein [Undibacterium oligocarboniphilum]|uniref:DUF3106 domain-containing protein n=1 Tax=Undibacterium oligocarboniphilum TaxID=666702 RepID=A0A850QKU1_9BURK|nr:DUF3106 domain-containing protein [Undibacterium oligocarboniphilum]MBC3869044.1 DUF3106 domain-containing protein [Undibacterium oligocarboniphilum]NVO77024.1 DUF3106 domain-containing protein [Undibacterium oligocarboniphilum]
MSFKSWRQIGLFLVISLLLPLANAGGSAAQPATAAVSTAHPFWSELTPIQKQALTPLAGEWDKLTEQRKKKWLEIATRYANMKPDEQARMQERMRDWLKLTPEQRMAARENYAKATQVKPEQKSAQWQQYQQLSPEEKKRLADEHEKKKRLTNLSAESIRNPQALPPLKQVHKPTTIKPQPVFAPAPASITAASLPVVTPPALPVEPLPASAASSTQTSK